MCKNTYFDTSGITFMFAIKKIIRELGSHRVLFGTDNPFLYPEVELGKVLNMGLSNAELDNIFFKTAEEVFRVKF